VAKVTKSISPLTPQRREMMSPKEFLWREIDDRAKRLKNEGAKALLLLGREFTEVDIEASIELRKEYLCKQKQCFANCQEIADNDMRSLARGLQYWEGFAIHDVNDWPNLVAEHAWLVSKARGWVIDPTWYRTRKDKDKVSLYVGLRIPREFIRKKIVTPPHLYEPLLTKYTEYLRERERVGRGRDAEK
jgi:hypothetical protein